MRWNQIIILRNSSSEVIRFASEIDLKYYTTFSLYIPFFFSFSVVTSFPFPSSLRKRSLYACYTYLRLSHVATLLRSWAILDRIFRVAFCTLFSFVLRKLGFRGHLRVGMAMGRAGRVQVVPHPYPWSLFRGVSLLPSSPSPSPQIPKVPAGTSKIY